MLHNGLMIASLLADCCCDGLTEVSSSQTTREIGRRR